MPDEILRILCPLLSVQAPEVSPHLGGYIPTARFGHGSDCMCVGHSMRVIMGGSIPDNGWYSRAVRMQ